MDIAITGASGLIGTALIPALERSGHNVVRVVRDQGQGISWDPVAGTIDTAGLEGIGAVIHLAGAGIGDRRWSDKVKRRILTSRVDGTRLLATTLAGLNQPPSVFLSASAIGYYGDRGSEVLSETSAAGTGFLSEVVTAWEAETAPAANAGIRTTLLRTGIVLSADGGALAKLLPLFKFGLGGKMGNGKQWWSCISLADHVSMTNWLLDNEVAGPVNLTCPEPTTNATFTKTLGQVLGRPTRLAVPSFGPKLVVGAELAEALLFTSARVEPVAATAAGYQFAHPTLESSISAALAADNSS
jgi:uncharacterized protein (TIGR01777 family)